MLKSDDRQYKYMAEDQAKCAYYKLHQTPKMSCQESIPWVGNVVDAIKIIGESSSDDMHLKDELTTREPRGWYTEEQIAAARERIHKKRSHIGWADRVRWGKPIEEFENDFLKSMMTNPWHQWKLIIC